MDWYLSLVNKIPHHGSRDIPGIPNSGTLSIPYYSQTTPIRIHLKYENGMGPAYGKGGVPLFQKSLSRPQTGLSNWVGMQSL